MKYIYLFIYVIAVHLLAQLKILLHFLLKIENYLNYNIFNKNKLD